MNLLEYNEVRNYQYDRKCFDFSPCIAPYNNIYFSVDGTCAPCWQTIGRVDKWSKNRSIKDIWTGEKFKFYRENLKNKIFLGECKICENNIDNDIWPLALAYDKFGLNDEWPTLMELELSNQCNLECIMCSGKLSSGIRKNRDKLPPLPMIYDDSFVEQLREFIPHLEELRFNGGEPLAQKIVFDICDIVSVLKPELKINIATNGTVYNQPVKNLLEKCNIHLNISIDSLVKEKYESIRINGDFNLLMDNVKKFHKYLKMDNKNEFSIMVNPMRNNWEEMPNYVEFTIKNDAYLWYNTIRYPLHLSIWNLPAEELKNIYEVLRTRTLQLEIEYKETSQWQTLDHLVNNQIKGWLDNQLLNVSSGIEVEFYE